MRNKTTGAALAAVLLAGWTAVAATSPDDKCESSKTRETGKLASCRMASLFRSVPTDSDPDQVALEKCES